MRPIYEGNFEIVVQESKELQNNILDNNLLNLIEKSNNNKTRINSQSPSVLKPVYLSLEKI